MRAIDLPLNSHVRDTPSTAAVASVPSGDFTWWFWIKAGIGFSIGAAIVTFFGMVFWATIGWRVWLTLFVRAIS